MIFRSTIIPAFSSQDPLQEKYRWFSPYSYCAANPIRFIDPDGQDTQITIVGNTITITAEVILTGNKATTKLAQIYQKDITSKWGSVKMVKYKDVKYNVKWDVKVRVMGKDETRNYNGVNNYMEVVGDDTSSVKNSNNGKIRSEGRNGRSLEDDCPMAHEFGHMLGISDKYITESESDSEKYGQPISPEWKGDVMAEPTFNPVKISNGTLNILFKGALDKYLDLLKFVNNPQVIEYRNKNNRENVR